MNHAVLFPSSLHDDRRRSCAVVDDAASTSVGGEDQSLVPLSLFLEGELDFELEPEPISAIGVNIVPEVTVQNDPKILHAGKEIIDTQVIQGFLSPTSSNISWGGEIGGDFEEPTSPIQAISNSGFDITDRASIRWENLDDDDDDDTQVDFVPSFSYHRVSRRASRDPSMSTDWMNDQDDYSVYSCATRDTFHSCATKISHYSSATKVSHDEDELQDAASISSAPSVATSNGKKARPGTVVLKPSRQSQNGKWYKRFKQLVQFKATFGHCCVPNNYSKSDAAFVQWVKRQRHQYKLKQEGKPSTLSDKRQQSLDDIGFVWDSHSTTWMERFKQLTAYHERHGHCNVPTNWEPNRQLSVWVKSQRRQYKLFSTGNRATITAERISMMESLNFEWNPRGL